MPCNLNEYSLCILLVFTERVCVCVCDVFFLTVYLILVINITTSRCVTQPKPNINPEFYPLPVPPEVLTNNTDHELKNSIEGTPLLQSSVRMSFIKKKELHPNQTMKHSSQKKLNISATNIT